MPVPRIVRPPEIASSVAHSSARYSGLRVEETMQAVPSLTLEVRCEIADSSEIGSQRGFEKRLSPTHTESKPSCSTTVERSSSIGRS